jgi:hypothetical protein
MSLGLTLGDPLGCSRRVLTSGGWPGVPSMVVSDGSVFVGS